MLRRILLRNTPKYAILPADIVDRVVLSERTVKSHVNNTLGKLGFTTRTQIATWAVARKLIVLDQCVGPVLLLRGRLLIRRHIRTDAGADIRTGIQHISALPRKESWHFPSTLPPRDGTDAPAV